MKKLFIIIVFLFIETLFAQNFTIEEASGGGEVFTSLASITITSDKIKYVLFDDYVKENGYKKKEVGYKKIYKDGLLFFKLPENFPRITYWQTTPTSDTLLILLGKITKDGNAEENIFYNYPEYNDGVILIFGGCAGSVQLPDGGIIPNFRFHEHNGTNYKDCSSYLIESGTEYTVDNLNNCNPDSPWVEGVKGDGIGEGFTIEKQGYTTLRTYLLIMNGYISYEKPYLYKQNNRIKKIKVTGLSSGKSKVLDVLDTPHPQTVDISFITEKEDIRVEIADVYKGTKYDDTCLNFCVTYPVKVIPYEDSVR